MQQGKGDRPGLRKTSIEGLEPVENLSYLDGILSCCRFREHEHKIVTKELESGYDQTEVPPRVQA